MSVQDIKFSENLKEMRNCLECGNEISYGSRSDRKFCCNNCKDKYNNKLRDDQRNRRRKIERILENNYNILDQIWRSGARQVMMGDLIESGFNPNYITATSRCGCHNEYRCFDFAYFLTESKLYYLRRIVTNI